MLWAAAHQFAPSSAPSAHRAGFKKDGFELGEEIFDAILTNSSGIVFSADDYDASWDRVRTPGGKLNLRIDVMLDALEGLASAPRPGTDPEFPLILSAGERRSFTANTIVRDPDWRKRDSQGALRISQADAARLGLADGDEATLTTRRGSAGVAVEISPMMRAGHISLPNGYGLTRTPNDTAVGVAPNELTSGDHRDPFAGTPYHKHVPARLERGSAKARTDGG